MIITARCALLTLLILALIAFVDWGITPASVAV